MSHPIAQPLRPLTEPEREASQRVSRAPSEAVSRHQRAVALLAVADGMSLIEAARAAGWCVHDTVTRLMRRFNERGLAALDDLPRSGHPRSYSPTERARIEQELRRSPLLKEDGTATWSLTTLPRTLARPGKLSGSLRVGPTSTCEARRPNCSRCCDPRLANYAHRRWSTARMRCCIPGSKAS